MNKIIKFFDKLEDNVRGTLSHYPMAYAIVGGFAIVLFWRGVWMTADEFPFLTGPVSIILSAVVMMLTGLFVSFFIGDRVILSGLKREKKIAEKTEEEVEQEETILVNIAKRIERMENNLCEIKKKLES